MNHSYEFYSARADEARKEAAEAKLDNVRDRALRAEATWIGLAKHAHKIAADREQAKRAREERDALEISDVPAS